MSDSLNLLWLYPDILNLHGERGSLMALCRAAEQLGLDANLVRVPDDAAPPPFETADLAVLCPGELFTMPRIVKALQAARPALEVFLARGGVLLAIGTSGAVVAQHTTRIAGESFDGLGLLSMRCTEREKIFGDDVWYEVRSMPGLHVHGSQIQVVDTQLIEAQPLGTLCYGLGNGDGVHEGAQQGGVIFTNCLGPLLVKNPWFARALIAQCKGMPAQEAAAACEDALERQSYECLVQFMQEKRKKAGKRHGQ